jgi:hypothetical protein
MKKTHILILCALGLFVQSQTFCQGLQVNPPTANTNKVVSISHPIYPTNFFFSEPQILSIDMNDGGDKLLKIQKSGETISVVIQDIQTDKSTNLKLNNTSNISSAHFLNESLIALQIQAETNFFEIIEISSSKVLSTINANTFIGATSTAAYFSSTNGSSATIENFDFNSKKTSQSGTISGEVYGWYFTKKKGIVGAAVHASMISKIHTIENDKLGKSLFEFSSSYYFEPKGCNNDGDIFYGITNFQGLTTYACAVSKNGIKPLNSKSGESCTDIFVLNNDVVLNTNNINAAEYQESQNGNVQKILAFAKEGFKGSSVKILESSDKTGNTLFCIQGETLKPKHFVWQSNKAKPVSNDINDGKNLTFASSEIVQIKTGELTPQTGRMYLPSKAEKSSFPLVVYIPNNIFLPQGNEFNPMVQHLCQSGYAVFVWNTRYSFRPKIGFAYSDLVGSFPEDLELLLSTLNKDYSLLPEKTFIVGEGLGAYLAMNASASFNGVVMNRIEFPGKFYDQDLTAARMFGEDAQSKWTTLDRFNLPEKTNYLSYQSSKSNQEIRLTNTIKQNKIKWTEHSSTSNKSIKITSNELSEVALWMQHLSQIEPRVIDNKPKVEVKKK